MFLLWSGAAAFKNFIKFLTGLLEHKLDPTLSGMSAKPNQHTKNNHHTRQADDIKCFDKCLGSPANIIKGIKPLFLAAHHRDVCAIVQIIQKV